MAALHRAPVVALIGRPNVGKSSLFNALTKTRKALVADRAGLTRDRQYEPVLLAKRPALLLDTGGLASDAVAKDMPQARHFSNASHASERALNHALRAQVAIAMDEAAILVWVLDGRTAIGVEDADIAARLRGLTKPIILAVNKTENAASIDYDFMRLGFEEHVLVSASHRQGMRDLETAIAAWLPKSANTAQTPRKARGKAPAAKTMPTTTTNPAPDTEANPKTNSEANARADTPDHADTDNTTNHAPSEPLRIAVIGRPNVGKSTLINALIGETRVLALDAPGTTRDSIEVPFTRNHRDYVLVDTAGIRRRRSVTDMVEKFSILKSLQAMEDAHGALFMLDAIGGVTDQDLRLAAALVDTGRALVVVCNKWDALDEHAQNVFWQQYARKLAFLSFAKAIPASALNADGIRRLLPALNKAHAASLTPLKTGPLNAILKQAMSHHAPPRHKGWRISPRYAHAGGHNPPTIVLHGAQVAKLPEDYQRYLIGAFREALGLEGTPIRLILKNTHNPYAK